MKRVLNKIKAVLSLCRIMNTDSNIISNSNVSVTQEDNQSRDVIKRVNKAFDEQMQSINNRALKPHQCVDPLSCNKSKCWKWSSDKIVSNEYEISMKDIMEEKRKMLKERKRRAAKLKVGLLDVD